jgi:hypothetical protein
VSNLDPQSKNVLNQLFGEQFAMMLQSFGFRQDAMRGTIKLGDWLYQLYELASGGSVSHPTTSNGTVVTVTDADTPVLAASSTRLGWSIRNSGTTDDIYVTRGDTATLDAPIVLTPGDRHDDLTGWQGPVRAICEAGKTSTLVVEELS